VKDKQLQTTFTERLAEASHRQRLKEKKRGEREGTRLGIEDSPLADKVEEIDRLLKQEIGGQIQNRYRIGLLVKEIHAEETQNGTDVYGNSPIEQIAFLLGIHQSILYDALNIARRFTEDEINAVIANVRPNGKCLTFSHLAALADLADDDLRLQGLEQAVAEGWTVCQTEAYVSKQLEGPISSGLPRPGQLNLKEAVELCQKQVDVFEKQMDRLAEKDPLAGHTDDMRKGRVSQEVVDGLRRLAERQRDIALQAQQLALQAQQRYEEALQAFHGGQSTVVEQDDVKIAALGQQNG
jgi:hypothetical protein